MKKDIKYYMSLKYPVTIETEEDGTFFISYIINRLIVRKIDFIDMVVALKGE